MFRRLTVRPVPAQVGTASVPDNLITCIRLVIAPKLPGPSAELVCCLAGYLNGCRSPGGKCRRYVPQCPGVGDSVPTAVAAALKAGCARLRSCIVGLCCACLAGAAGHKMRILALTAQGRAQQPGPYVVGSTSVCAFLSTSPAELDGDRQPMLVFTHISWLCFVMSTRNRGMAARALVMGCRMLAATREVVCSQASI